jgi:hypothetical protein
LEDDQVQDVDRVRAAFVDPDEFWSSPLYRHLSAVVADDDFLVGVAAHTRPGQVPTFAFFGAVHAVLLAGAPHRLAGYYPSVVGDAALPPDDGAGPALLDFAGQHTTEIQTLLVNRLVQTNHVQRAAGLRLGLSEIASRVGSRAVHLLEVGSSAGLVLRQSWYGYYLGDRHFGDSGSPIQLHTEWRGTTPAPDLDALPVIASLTGIDLDPLDPADEADRRWLEALVWPENRGQAQQLHAALALAAATPVPVLAGDAIDCCPQWGNGIPAGDPRVVFHCATRMHVPTDRLDQFDVAINDLGEAGPLYRIAIEGDGVAITYPDGAREVEFDVDGHLAWARRHKK